MKTVGKTQLFGSWPCSRCGRLHLHLWSACMLCTSKLANTAVLLHSSATTPCHHTRSEPLDVCCLPHRTNLPPARAPPRSGGHAKQADATAFSLGRLGDPPKTANVQFDSCFTGQNGLSVQNTVCLRALWRRQGGLWALKTRACLSLLHAHTVAERLADRLLPRK